MIRGLIASSIKNFDFSENGQLNYRRFSEPMFHFLNIPERWLLRLTADPGARLTRMIPLKNIAKASINRTGDLVNYILGQRSSLPLTERPN